jgi:phage-related protein
MNQPNCSKKIIWLASEVKTPPFFQSTRIEVGFWLSQLQAKELLVMPVSKLMSSIGDRCHELRIEDIKNKKKWRVIYRIDEAAIIILEVFAKTTQKTPQQIIDVCLRRLRLYDQDLDLDGWRVGHVAEFLQLPPAEIAIMEMRLSLSRLLKQLRQQQPTKNTNAIQSRVDRLKVADEAVSIDLLIESLLLLGATRDDIAAAMSKNEMNFHDQGHR